MKLKTPDHLDPQALAHLAKRLELDDGEQVLLFYDDAMLWSSSNSGLIVTDRRVAQLERSSVKALPYDDIAEVQLEEIASVTYRLTISDRAQPRIDVVLVLSLAQLNQLLAPLRSRIDKALIHEAVVVHEPARYTLASKQVRCGHCGGEMFNVRQVLLNTRIMTAFNLDAFNQTAHGLECITCGLVQLFTHSPVVSSPSSFHQL
jgi:hypothetical protein